MKLLLTVRKTQVFDDGRFLTFTCKGDVDNDGPDGNPEHDPDHQDQTSLRHNGESINSEVVRGIVLPPEVIRAVAPKVMGSQCWASFKGTEADGVVFDVGPRGKIGEMSVAMAKAIGVPPSPTHGGVPAGVSYRVQYSVPAVVDGVTYSLQAS